MELVTRGFYGRGDLELILSSPVAAWQLFAVRIAAMAVTVGSTSLVLAAPFINVAAWFGGMRWLSAYAVVAALAMVAVGVAVTLTAALFRAFGPKRTRLGAQIVAAVIGTSFVIGVQFAAILSLAAPFQIAFLQSEAVLRSAPDIGSALWWPARAIGGDLPALAIVMGVGITLLTVAGLWSVESDLAELRARDLIGWLGLASATTDPATPAALRAARTRRSPRPLSRGDSPLPGIVFDERKEGVLEAGMAYPDLPAQLVQIPFSEEAAGHHHTDAVSHALGDLQDVRRHDHGAAATGALAQHTLDQPRRASIETGERLIQNDQPRFEVEIFQRRQLVVDHRFVREPRHDLLGADRIGQCIYAKDRYRSAIRLQQPRHHPQCRGFARAIRSQQCVKFAGANRQIQCTDRRSLEMLGETPEFEGVWKSCLVHYIPKERVARQVLADVEWLFYRKTPACARQSCSRP